METITHEPITFMSHDGTTLIHGYVWSGGVGAEPRGIVQLVHGMAEYIERYDAFARFLVGEGFVVCGHDHIGHGKSVSDPSRWGCLPAEDGKTVLVEDVHTLHELMTEHYPTLPYFLLGHSMGSFIARSYSAHYGSDLSGSIICGTGHMPPTTSRAGNFVARVIASLKGSDTKSMLLHNMGVGGYNKGIENPRTDQDWLSYNTDNVDAYVADEACGYPFSAGGYITLTDLTAEIATTEHMAQVPKELPLLYISGAEDPVGERGAGVRKVEAMALAAGIEDVTTIIYDGMRHEILNEDGRLRVYTDVRNWIEARL